MQFGEKTNSANILDEFFNQIDSLIHSYVIDLTLHIIIIVQQSAYTFVEFN